MAITKAKSKVSDENLYQEYPAEFLAIWEGCQHLDCMPECSLARGFCARLQVSWEKWIIAQPDPIEAADEAPDEADDGQAT